MSPASQLPTKRRTLLPEELGVLIEFTKGEDTGRRVPLVFSRTVLGRKFGDILVRDIKVSATHVAIEFRGREFRCTDLASSNGTFVEGERIKDSRIEVGQEVQIGMSAFRIEIDPVAASRLKDKNPSFEGWSEGGVTELITREFLEADINAADRKQARREPDRVKGIRLTVVFGPKKGQTYASEKARIVVGRVGADIQLADADVSRKHFLLERQEDGQLLLRDLASTNGTFVNDKRVANAVLTPEDRIRVGKTILRFTETTHE